MNKRFLNKIVDQIMRETEMVYPTSDELGYVNFPFSKMYHNHDTLIKKNWTIVEMGGFFSSIPSSLFKRHLEEIYSLNTWGDPYNEELNYLWDRYVEEFMNKLRKGINIVDTPDNDIPQRWVGQLDESFKKGNTISFLIKVVDQLINETEIVNVGGQNIGRSPWSNISHLGSAFWDRLRKHCRSVYGLNTDELLWVEDNYRERLDSKLRNNLSESKVFEKDKKFLDKLLDYIKSETKFKERSKFMHNSGRTIYAGYYVQLPFFPEDWYRGVKEFGWEYEDFTHWVHTTLGVKDPTEINYLWKRYLEWVNKKCNNILNDDGYYI
jgi:hypothetical protein